MIYLIRLQDHKSERLNEVVGYALASLSVTDFTLVESPEEFFDLVERFNMVLHDESIKDDLDEKPVFLFAVALPEDGYVPAWHELLARTAHKKGSLEGVIGGLVVDGEGEFYTKDFARHLVFACNRAGIRFPGKPLVEATGSLYNFSTSAMVRGTDRLGAYRESVRELVEKLIFRSKLGGELNVHAEPKAETEEGFDGECRATGKKNIVMIHASNKATSNTLMLWEMVKRGIVEKSDKLDMEVDIQEISIRNGEVVDCRGCDFEACRHFGEQGDCFYGGLVVDRVYPAVLSCDALILACPNYNDAVSANMMAVFNRLTALFYNNDFSKKEIYALIVSGYSGGDIVAEQIIGAMNLNKGFELPPRFALLATANNPGSITEAPGIEEQAGDMADRIIKSIIPMGSIVDFPGN